MTETKTPSKKPRNNYKKLAQLESERASAEERRAIALQAQLDAKAAEGKKRYDATVYCTNCLVVNSVSIPPGVRIIEGDCLTCRVRGTQLLVRIVNADRSQ
ncbi:hypothetical protein E3O62_02640 [Cryobacterium sp. TMT2-15-1]|uniref:hypothetical protein n=1 Tax=Cryobacterium sp. TMT2-15-1 TaxID=1259246 RepID=UPI00106BE95C|nr:hypothetical protein [Cryobacterium sp. TMT2-15-1]TFC63743.1 hypothetical protein E3O62_02640 [Cryobacterium sp. TMT2-15-1]